MSTQSVTSMQTTSPYSPSRTRYPSRPLVSQLDPHDEIAAKAAQLRAKIAKLQAQERRQRLIEDLKRPKRKIRGISFMNAFLIVLGLHLAVAGGIYGFSTLRKARAAADKLALSQPSPVYAGVPESSAKPLNVDSLHTPDSTLPVVQKITEKDPKKRDALALSSSEKKSPVHRSSSRADRSGTCLKPSPSVRALFSHGHSQVKKDSMDQHEVKEPIREPLVATPHPFPAPPTNYTVGPGDTLSKVAAMMGTPAAKIMAVNGMDSGSSLRAGQKLSIPSPETHQPLQLVSRDPEISQDKSESPELFTPKMERIAPNGIYKVQRGDNPYMVARKLGVSFTDLMMANTISNPADVTVGMRLKVPQSRLASN